MHAQPAALGSPFPSSFGSPGRRKHGESLTRRETSSCRTATHHPAQASCAPAHAGLAGGPSGRQGSSSLRMPGSCSALAAQNWDQPLKVTQAAGRFLRLAARSPRASRATPAPTGPHRRPSTLSLSLPPAPPPSLAGGHVGVREGSGLRGHRWLQIGRPQVPLSRGQHSGLTVEEPATEPPEPPPGFLGPGATLPGAGPARASPTPLCTPESERGTLSRSPLRRRGSTLEGKLQTLL